MPEFGAEQVVLVLDPVRLVAEAVSVALASDPRVVRAGWAVDLDDAITRLASLQPNLLLADIAFARHGSGDLLAKVRAVVPNVLIVIMAMQFDRDAFTAGIQAGSAGFVGKSQSLDELRETLFRVASGELVIPDALVAELRSPVRAARRPSEPLTEREHQVLQLLASGASTSDIVGSLVVSVHTVRNHVRSILRKLDVHSRLEAVAIAAGTGDIDLPTPDRRVSTG